ncbi:hypothetical protein TrLO_g13840 [Triparma laevis f. longispina]|uniref:Uncharacterized protein n=1 Tax=Triparma laevis f. longispina TaxID=1714387 RepID=A0A9W7AMK6_9STRA|nr:hypothetical protein TrLO_g13840 [Triparma laevis f. longispina]
MQPYKKGFNVVVWLSWVITYAVIVLLSFDPSGNDGFRNVMVPYGNAEFEEVPDYKKFSVESPYYFVLVPVYAIINYFVCGKARELRNGGFMSIPLVNSILPSLLGTMVASLLAQSYVSSPLLKCLAKVSLLILSFMVFLSLSIYGTTDYFEYDMNRYAIWAYRNDFAGRFSRTLLNMIVKLLFAILTLGVVTLKTDRNFAFEEKLQAWLSTRRPYEFSNFHRIMGCGVLLVLNLPVIGVYWSALIQQQKYPQDDYTLPIWHNICLLLSPLLLLFSMLLFISRLKSKSRLNTVMFFVSPITMLVEGMMVAFSGDENISSSGTIYMIAAIGNLAFFPIAWRCRSSLMLLDAQIANHLQSISYELIAMTPTVLFLAAEGIGCLARARSYKLSESLDSIEYCLPISDTNFFICQSMVFKFVFDILMKFTVEWSTLPNLTQCKGVTSFELLYYSINGLATGLGLALFGMSRDIPKAASKDMLEMITLISKIGSNVFYVMWATLRISAYLRLQFSIRDEPDEERGGGGEVGGEVVVRPRKNFLKGVNARILAFLRVEKGCPNSLAFARKSILFFFPPEIIHSHIVGLVPKILTAAVPPLVYLTFKSSTCIEVHYIVSDRTIEVSDEQCFGVQYSARPLQMLISGIAILRFFGIHYVFKDITAERIVTLKGVSKTDALQGTLFMISVTISVIMFGIGGEYEEDVGKCSSIWDGGTKGLQTKRSSLESVGYKHDLERVRGKMLISGGGGEGEENVMNKMDFDPGFF